MDERPYRKPLRYCGHDYRAPCCVHVTICTHDRQPLFGTVVSGEMDLNDAGRFADASLKALHSDPNGIVIDTHIVMPDHLHAIIVLKTTPHGNKRKSVPDVVRAFKMRIVKSWPSGVRLGGWQPYETYETHLWQRSFYDTLIFDDAHLQHTRKYILANPSRWIERTESQS